MKAAMPVLHPAGRVVRAPIAFGPFVLDAANEVLTREGQQVRLRPKTFAMLAYLVAAAGRLVTKKDLLDDLWRDVFVGDAALKTLHARDPRGARRRRAAAALSSRRAHRRGYRFIAPVAPVADAATERFGGGALHGAANALRARTNATSTLRIRSSAAARSTSCSPPAAVFTSRTTRGPSRRWRASSCGWHRSRG